MTRVALPALTLLLVACGGEAPAPATPAPAAPAPAAAPAAPPACTYTADVAAVTVGWKAFKFTEKTGVGGGFSAVTVAGAKGAPAAHSALDGLSFQIATTAVDTKNPDRDKKIVEQFFGTMKETAALKGSLAVTGPDAGSLTVTMNGATHPVPVKLAVEGETLKLSGALDLTTWGAGPSIDALNKVCEDLHKGADGVTKLWPDVEISAVVPLKKDCAPAAG
jgi:polyisoprenoid-binding protein YceI